ncbi:hypothetical protein IKN40_02805 [bacterium]|nr:hypothetical protein [bacterium]
MFYKSDDSDEYFIDIEDCCPSEKSDPFVANEEQYDEKEKMDKKINSSK